MMRGFWLQKYQEQNKIELRRKRIIMRNTERIENHPDLKKIMIQVQKNIKENDISCAMINMEKCLEYMVDQCVRELRGDLGNLNFLERLMKLVNDGQMSKQYSNLYNIIVQERNTTDIQRVRGIYSEIIQAVDSFLDGFEYPSFKKFISEVKTDEIKKTRKVNIARVNEAFQNHPKLVKLNQRVGEHIDNKNYEDAATNMRLSVEYMVLQYVKEYAQDLYPENLATSITELRNRNLISADTADDWHVVRKIGNKVGAHLNETPLNIEEIRECYGKYTFTTYEFYEDFLYPSSKEIAPQYKNAQAKGGARPEGHSHSSNSGSRQRQMNQKTLTPELIAQRKRIEENNRKAYEQYQEMMEKDKQEHVDSARNLGKGLFKWLIRQYAIIAVVVIGLAVFSSLQLPGGTPPFGVVIIILALVVFIIRRKKNNKDDDDKKNIFDKFL